MMVLSEDIIFWEILTLLPVKSLLKFRCVCKSWSCLLSDPDEKFINLHLERTSKNPEYESLIMDRRDHFTLNKSIHILTRSKFSYTRIDNSPQHYKNMLGCINGLVCLRWENKFLLWNPATALAITLVPPEYYWKALGRSGYGFYGFGWNCVENDYKVVVCSNGEEELQGVVYSSNRHLWTPLLRPHSYQRPPHCKFPNTIVNGCPYWANFNVVTKFEVESNQLKEFLFSSQIFVPFHYRILLNLRDSLVVMLYSYDSYMIDIHQLDEECGVWSKTYTVGPTMCNLGKFLLCFKYGGEIVFNDAMMLYDPKINEVKVVGDNYWSFCSGFSYTPSLVFLHGMETLYTQSHWIYPNVRGWGRPRLVPGSPKSPLRSIASRLLRCFLCWN